MEIDDFLESAERDYGEIYIDTFFNDAERPLTTADVGSNAAR